MAIRQIGQIEDRLDHRWNACRLSTVAAER
jgi:hypothetical protein